MILDTIHSPADVRQLSLSELEMLSGEIREFLIQSVAQTGGHLSSNLGAVELTIALHRVFDTLQDPLVFDVGHQAYVHKLLTGRKDQFHTLRQWDGLSGFPKPYESPHDAFIAGHASNSVSVALGMARALALQGKDSSALALIGDGALSGGLAYEGLSDAGGSKLPLIVILNDNGMSIQPNVGGMHRHLRDLRCQPSYYHFKKWYRSLFGKQPQRNPLYRQIHKVKTSLKRAIYPKSSLFEDMGFVYLGPVDGHDIQQLTQTFDWAKKLQCPVVVHVKTIKGKGYRFAEENPGKFHGVSPFDPKTGVTKSGDSFSSHFGAELVALAGENPKLCGVTAAMADGTGLSPFEIAYPERFFDVAIAEGHAVAMSAGLCKTGMRPVFAVYSTFLQRGYDMLFHDVALQSLPVVFGIDRAGLVGADGETHHGCLDVQYLCQIPNFTVLCPSNYAEMTTMLHWATSQEEGPVAIRYPRGGEGEFIQDTALKTTVELRSGADVTLVGYGMCVNHLLEAAHTLETLGVQAKVVKLNRIAPLILVIYKKP
ncbi:1-deoxy-D-xylulose-5-phosphate synthase [Bengtsoniella intestinalis]|uniref:1-deoxy-D-xylulose-5-phosphate synthase n=1 Tax=Bengtsoniella intestinalis TaxID=3073143 RepID=UPI00391EFC26